MIVRDLFHDMDEVRVIARAIFEDKTQMQDVDGWITKYYAQISKLKNSKVRKSSMMFFLSVNCDGKRQYGSGSGFEYSDIKTGKENHYAIEYLEARKYASLYVPEYSIQRYGKEVVAAEALREYGWNGYDTDIICPDNIRERVKVALEHMESGIFPMDEHYLDRCRRQFKLSYEGKKVPMWEEDKAAGGVVKKGHAIEHILLGRG